jgi:multidrug transporter EmrE-like cation transporter
MNWSLLLIIITQLLFSTGDLIARMNMSRYGFKLAAFKTTWFLIYTITRTIATFLQLYIFTTIPLGKMMALFGAVSIMLANILGLLVLKEILSPASYIGISLAVIAFLVLAFYK